MTELLKKAFVAAQKLPDSEQDEIAGAVLRLLGTDETPIELSTEEKAAIERSKAAASRGEYATEAEVHEVWARHRS